MDTQYFQLKFGTGPPVLVPECLETSGMIPEIVAEPDEGNKTTAGRLHGILQTELFFQGETHHAGLAGFLRYNSSAVKVLLHTVFIYDTKKQGLTAVYWRSGKKLKKLKLRGFLQYGEQIRWQSSHFSLPHTGEETGGFIQYRPGGF